MFRRKKNDDAAPAEDNSPVAAAPPPPPPPPGQPGVGSEPGAAAIAFAEGDERQVAPAGPGPVPAAAMDEPPPPPAAPPSYQGPPAGVAGRGPMATPPPPPVFGDQPLTAGFWVQSFTGALSKSGQPSAADLERQAAADFQAAIMPGLLGLRDEVPDAASPDDAMRVLAEREAGHEYPDDPGAESLKGSDIFRKDASVYYRIRTHFERPRRKVGWGEPWRPPPGLAKPDPPTRRALNRG